MLKVQRLQKEVVTKKEEFLYQMTHVPFGIDLYVTKTELIKNDEISIKYCINTFCYKRGVRTVNVKLNGEVEFKNFIDYIETNFRSHENLVILLDSLRYFKFNEIKLQENKDNFEVKIVRKNELEESLLKNVTSTVKKYRKDVVLKNKSINVTKKNTEVTLIYNKIKNEVNNNYL